ncbi:hypothetical protein CAOG_05415 [Capsaspora owczarzaki ATCC 30864]|uniref:hypothetical protein n=1 Tax=Capsaspora owczarzaki (strain ATCC 30864) TaxID=595528 RepID=UPI0003520BB6|nr:hypothetical protein CAOG_05415 [Capsaspora owczarzaki ATCC 30864]|eukprot:XP_004346088.2 hypothetical protein CAOG_05415 [Capsaspora owczarzaki ATCC 30864]
MNARHVLVCALALCLVAAVTAQLIPQDGFQEATYVQDITEPIKLVFAPDGSVWLAEKGGRIRYWPTGITDPSNHGLVIADLRTKVFNWWDRGLLSIVHHPAWPAQPYLYVLYSADNKLGSPPPRYSDQCDYDLLCEGSAVLARLKFDLAVPRLVEEVNLISDWCSTSPSHHTGDMFFGPEGALHVLVGDSAHFDFVDYGQNERDTCQSRLPAGTQYGGAFKSQITSILTGHLLRLDPMTGAAWPQNPARNMAGYDPRIAAIGIRNGFRATIDKVSNDIWIGDVGWADWEEVNVIRAGTLDARVPNLGWPCYEGSNVQPSYQALRGQLCTALYNAGAAAHHKPFYSYKHNDRNFAGVPTDPTLGSSVTGVAVNRGSKFPTRFNGALFVADFSREVIFTFKAGADGKPSATSIEPFRSSASGVCDLVFGPDGALYWISIFGGYIKRVSFSNGANQPPIARLTASPGTTSATVPFVVTFDARSSSDPDGDALVYDWDYGQGFQDANGHASTRTRTFSTAGSYITRVRVTDPQGLTNIYGLSISAGVNYQVTIDAPNAMTALFVPGTNIPFSGRVTETIRGEVVPASQLTWTVTIQHCPSIPGECLPDGTRAPSPVNCHTHPYVSLPGVASGTVSAPAHEYPAWLTFQLAASIPQGGSTPLTVAQQLEYLPLTGFLEVDSVPSGLKMIVGSTVCITPCRKQLMRNAPTSISAPDNQDQPSSPGAGQVYKFARWSDDASKPATRTEGVPSNQPQLRLVAVFNLSARPAGYTDTLALDPANLPCPNAPTSSPPAPQPSGCSSAVENQLVIDAFNSGGLTTNGLGMYTDTDGTMVTFTKSGGKLTLGTKADGSSYWYSLLSSATTCLDATQYDYLSLVVTAPTNTRVTIELQAKDAGCQTFTATLATVALQQYAASPFDGTAKTVNIPLSAFTGVPQARLHAITLSAFLPNAVSVQLDDIRLVKFADCSSPSSTRYAAPTSSATPVVVQPTGSCSTTELVVDDFANAAITINTLGFLTSDDGSMTQFTQTGGKLSMTSSAAGASYWYSLLSTATTCLDVSTYNSLALRVKAPAGTTMILELQVKNVGCTAYAGSTARVALQSYAETPFDGTEKQVTIPFSAFQTVSMARVHAIAITDITPNPVSFTFDDIKFVKTSNCASPSSKPGVPPSSSATPIVAASTSSRVSASTSSRVSASTSSRVPASSTAVAPASSTASGPGGSCTAAPVVVDNFNDATITVNTLGHLTSDDGSMAQFAISGGALNLVGKASGGSYWYSLLGGTGGGTCFSAASHNALQLDIKAPAAMQTATIRFASLPAATFLPARLHALALEIVSPATAAITLDNIRFVCV